MTTLNGLSYETVLDMVSSFQWLPESLRLRISTEIDTDNPVMESLFKFTAEICKLNENNTEDFTSLIPKAVYEADSLISGKYSRMVVTTAQQVVEFIGVGPYLIGVVNLYSVAYALAIRKYLPDLWNSFCYKVDKPDWITDTKKQNSSVSRSAVSPNAIPSNNLAQLTPEDDADTLDNAMDAIDPEDRSNDPQVRARHAGLATAFDDKEFNRHAEKLLKGQHDEDTEAQRTVITGSESTPTRCSKHHQVIQEKYNAARYRRTGKKGM